MEEDAVRHARDVVAAMHELAARLAAPQLSAAVIEHLRRANDRFGRAVESGDARAAIEADDEFHGALVAASGNPAIVAVLKQFEPVIRRAEYLRFVSVDRFAARERHAELIRLCEAGDADAAADLAYATWHSLPVAVPGQPATPQR